MKYLKTRKNITTIVIIVIYIIWSAAFIFRTSMTGVDGNRYFCLFDDAMISMRYAWNLSHGNGLVWNPGVRIEGYSNLLMTLIMAAITSIFSQSNAVLVVQILGIFTVLGLALIAKTIARNLLKNRQVNHSDFLVNLVFLVILAYYPLSYWSIMGMETGLLTLFLLSAIHWGIKYTENFQTKYLLLFGLSFGFALLVRNDSISYAFVSFIFLITIVAKQGILKNKINEFILSIGIYSTFVISQILFRYIYYKKFVPNTYVLKLEGMHLSDRLINGIGFLMPFLISIFPLVIFLLVDTISEIKVYKVYFLLLVGVAISYQIFVGGDPWPYWRMITPTMPLFFILLSFALFDLFIKVQGTSLYPRFFSKNPLLSQNAIPPFFTVFTLLIILFQLNRPFLREALLIDDAYTVKHNYINVNKAIIIDRITTDEATIGVTWAGAIPYYVDRFVIDFLGRSDETIAKLPPDLKGDKRYGMTSVPGHNKYDLNYSIVKLRPTVALSIKWGHDDLTEWSADYYTKVLIKGYEFYLLSDSQEIIWENVEAYQ